MRGVRDEIGGYGRASSRAAPELLSLHAYRHARIVVLNASTPANEAALAMQKNEVGCVLVNDGRGVVGIVTDRDIALRVVATGRGPRETPLREIMSSPVTVLDVNADHREAIRLMRERNIRRVPLLDEDRVVGMVTLDDLLLERTATADELAEIVRAQVVEGGPARSHRFDEWTSLARKHSRALGTKSSLVATVRAAADDLSREQAEQALALVLESLVLGVEAADRHRLIARLPVAFRQRLRELGSARRAATSSAELERRIARGLGIDMEHAAEVATIVGGAVARFVRASDAIGRKLPADLRALLGASSSRPRRATRRSPRSDARR